MHKYIFIIASLLSSLSIKSQELNCQVSVISPEIQGTTEKQIFEQLQKAVFDFMNNTKWTKDNYLGHEKIECSILINVRQKLSLEDYSGTIQVQSRRPVYNSSYYSPLLNYIDENFTFKFQQFQQLDFNLNSYQNNLTSVLAFYAYLFIAKDSDSFSNLGGTEFYQKAQLVVTNAQASSDKGWRSFEDKGKNRYWIVEDILQPVYLPIRECTYKFHRLGLDIMYSKNDEGRKEILKSTELLLEVYKNRPASFMMEMFCNAKTDEIVNIFSKAPPNEKERAVEIFTKVDPANSIRYFKIQPR